MKSLTCSGVVAICSEEEEEEEEENPPGGRHVKPSASQRDSRWI